MLGSHGMVRKQKPWEESIRVPFLLRYPAKYGRGGRQVSAFLNAHDIMPTLLGICDLPIPDSVDGSDVSPLIESSADDDGALLACFHPFGEWTRDVGGREFRGIRTERFTYCRSLEGPWLLYDNQRDPWQLENLVGRADYAEAQAELDALLTRKLDEMGDEFLPGDAYLERWGYAVDATGTLPIR